MPRDEVVAGGGNGAGIAGAITAQSTSFEAGFPALSIAVTTSALVPVAFRVTVSPLDTGTPFNAAVVVATPESVSVALNVIVVVACKIVLVGISIEIFGGVM